MRRKAKRPMKIARQHACRIQNTPRKAKERAAKLVLRAAQAVRLAKA